MARRTWTCATCRIEHTYTLSLVALFDSFITPHGSSRSHLSFTPSVCHPCAAFFEFLSITFYFFLLFIFLFPFLMTNDDSMTINNLRDSANGTFVTLDDYLSLTLHGAVAEMCEECEALHETTVPTVVGAQSSSSFVPSVIKTDVLFLLQKYGERNEVITTRQIEQILHGCRFPECCWNFQYFMANSHTSQMQWSVVSTLCQMTKKHLNQKMDPREHQNSARIGSCNLLLARKLWSWGQNHVHVHNEQRRFSLKGQNFSWLEHVGHEVEQQRAGNLRNVNRRLCVKIEYEWFCMAFKGQSKTTRIQLCQVIHKNVPIGWRIWTEVEPGEYSISDCEVSKKLINLLRHGGLLEKMMERLRILENQRQSSRTFLVWSSLV